jgi:hypothetical protein
LSVCVYIPSLTSLGNISGKRYTAETNTNATT